MRAELFLLFAGSFIARAQLFTPDSSEQDPAVPANQDWIPSSNNDPGLLAFNTQGTDGQMNSEASTAHNTGIDTLLAFSPGPVEESSAEGYPSVLSAEASPVEADAFTSMANQDCSSGTHTSGAKNRRGNAVCSTQANLDEDIEELDQYDAETTIKNQGAFQRDGSWINSRHAVSDNRAPCDRLTQKVPACCMGPTYEKQVDEGSGRPRLFELWVLNCVAYFEGRPRCANVKERWCCRGWAGRTVWGLLGANCIHML